MMSRAIITSAGESITSTPCLGKNPEKPPRSPGDCVRTETHASSYGDPSFGRNSERLVEEEKSGSKAWGVWNNTSRMLSSSTREQKRGSSIWSKKVRRPLSLSWTGHAHPDCRRFRRSGFWVVGFGAASRLYRNGRGPFYPEGDRH